MTPVSDTALDSLHAAATEIFTGALEACNIDSAFDRRLRFERNTLRRLIPDGSGPDTINLSQYKRIFVIALGKAAGPMLEVLLQRMDRRQGLRGICCSKYLPKRRNWRFRYFEGGHPLPNEESFAAARATLNMLKKAKKDTLIFFLISGGGSAMFDLPLDPQIGLEDTIAFHQALLASGAPINEVNTLRKHFSAVKGGRLAIAAPEATKVSLAAARRAASHPGCTFVGPDFAGSFDRERRTRHSDQVRLGRKTAHHDREIFRSRRSARVAGKQGLATDTAAQAAPAGRNRQPHLHCSSGHVGRRRSVSRFGL